ncbi:hypothetical protein ACEPAI_386 [Sanghuangporus weigelae]
MADLRGSERAVDSKDGTPASQSGGVAKASTESSIISRILGMAPAWISDNLRSARSWKLLARCWVATWATLIVMLPNKSLTTLGNTAFFGILVSLIIPPSMPVQMFFFAVTLLLIGQLLGWGLGSAAMKAATSARDQVVLRSTYEAAEQTAATAANPDVAFRLEIFEGIFLDARSTVVYGVMLGVFSFMFGLGRAYRPRLALLVIFGQIVLNIFCTFGPLFPNTQFMIVTSFLVSTSVYFAIGIVCCVLIFPETMNHSYLVAVEALLGQLKGYGQLYEAVLEMSPEDIIVDPNGVVDRCAKQRISLVLAVQNLEQKSGLINAEFSYGRWNGSDARTLEEPLRVLVARMTSFYSYPKLLHKTSPRSLSRSTTNSEDTARPSSTVNSMEEIAGDTELLRQLHSRRFALEAEKNVRMADISPILFSSTAELRTACLEGLDAAQDMIKQVNRRRWERGSQTVEEKEAALTKALDRLRASVDAFKSQGRLAIVEPFVPILREADADHESRKRLPIRSLIVASSFSAQLVVTANGIIDLLDLILKTTNRRRHARLWASSGLRALGNIILRREKNPSLEMALGENVVVELEKEEEEEEVAYRRDPDSKPPTNIIQKIMNGIHNVYEWSKTPEAMFGFKYAILTVLLWLPAVLRSSANLYYVEKGVWALIMAQTALNVYVSDTIYSIVTRTLGTFLGLVMGLLIWYIGNGSGNGNPYGTAAAYGVFIIPVLFARINAPPTLLQPLIMFSATLSLIVGYSWIDAKLNLVGNPGVGWPIAWKRFVLVMIGIGAIAILSILPPVSGRKAVRLQNAVMVDELSSLYSYLMSIWITEDNEESRVDSEERELERPVADEETGTEKKGPGAVKPGWAASVKKRMLRLMEQLQTMQMQTAMARFEGNIRGAWPSEEYEKLLEKESDILAALGQLASALYHLDPDWRASLNRRTLILNPNFITDVMSIFALVSQSLRTGVPMHQILPTTLMERLLYHSTHDILSRRDQERLEDTTYLERVSSYEFVFFSTGVTAVSQVIESLDEIHRITRGLCGEIPFRGFNEWKNDYDRVFRLA